MKGRFHVIEKALPVQDNEDVNNLPEVIDIPDRVSLESSQLSDSKNDEEPEVVPSQAEEIRCSLD